LSPKDGFSRGFAITSVLRPLSSRGPLLRVSSPDRCRLWRSEGPRPGYPNCWRDPLRESHGELSCRRVPTCRRAWGLRECRGNDEPAAHGAPNDTSDCQCVESHGRVSSVVKQHRSRRVAWCPRTAPHWEAPSAGHANGRVPSSGGAATLAIYFLLIIVTACYELFRSPRAFPFNPRSPCPAGRA